MPSLRTKTALLLSAVAAAIAAGVFLPWYLAPPAIVDHEYERYDPARSTYSAYIRERNDDLARTIAGRLGLGTSIAEAKNELLGQGFEQDGNAPYRFWWTGFTIGCHVSIRVDLRGDALLESVDASRFDDCLIDRS